MRRGSSNKVSLRAAARGALVHAGYMTLVPSDKAYAHHWYHVGTIIGTMLVPWLVPSRQYR